MTTKCGFTGCKRPARWAARKLWGKGGTLCTCDGHRPGAKLTGSLAAKLAGGRSWYEVKPL